MRRSWEDIYNDARTNSKEQVEYLAKLDFGYFFENVLGIGKLNPMQKGIYDYLNIDNIGFKSDYVCVEAPRQHGKSELTTSFILWVAYKSKDLIEGKMSNYPFVSILVVSGSETQSFRIIEKCKHYIEENEALNHLKGDNGKKDYQWSASTIKLTTGCKIQSTPFTSSIRGGTHQIVLCDDLLRDNNISQSDSIRAYVENIIPTTTQSKGIQLLVGTPMSGDDLFSYVEEELYHKKNVYKFKKFRAVWDGDDDGEWDSILWKRDDQTVEDRIEELIELQDIMGVMSFAKEMLCDPRLAGENLFNWKMLQDCMDEDVVEINSGIPNHQYYLGVDVAFSNTKTADYGSFTIVGIDENDKPYLAHQYRKKGMRPEEYETHIMNLHELFNFRRIVIEEKGLAIDLVMRLMNDRYLGGLIKGFKTGRGKGAQDDKDRMISRLQTALINKNIRLPKNYGPHVKVLYNELCNFGIKAKDGKETYEAIAGHDDTVMSFCMAFDGATDPSIGKLSLQIF